MWKGLLGFWAPKHRRIENYNLDDEACHRFFFQNPLSPSSFFSVAFEP
jgi:hypothetical protein